jgi:hypothetical protein
VRFQDVVFRGNEVPGRVAENDLSIIVPPVKVRLDFDKSTSSNKQVVVEMKFLPRVGELLVSGNEGTCEVLKVIHTPETAEQDVVLQLGRRPA